MTEGTRDLITWILGTCVTLGVILGFAVQKMILPYLRRHLIAPVQEVRKQVTENHHTNDRPTILDRLDDLEGQITSGLEVARGDVRAVSRVLDGHLASGERWMELYDRELALVKDRVAFVERTRSDPQKPEAGPT